MTKIGQATHRGVTLKEVLVVIIVMLFLFALLLYPIVLGLIRSVKQVRDMDNIEACGISFNNYANDHDGAFPTTNTTSTDLLNLLVKEGYITNPRIVSGSGTIVQKSSGMLTSNNVAWGCSEGLSTSNNSGYALLWSKGAIPSVSNGKLIIDASNTYWGKNGKPFAVIFSINGAMTPQHFSSGSFVATNTLNPTNGLITNVYTSYLNP